MKDYLNINKTRFIVVILTSIYFIYYSFSYTEWHFIDNINLIIHEAGHVVFSLFGELITLMGGSFFQIFIPIIFVFYFYRQKQYFESSLLLFWVGQNFINVSVYMSDAIVMQLPLLGGDSVLHDWNNIFYKLGVLKHTDNIADIFFVFGIFIIACSIYFSFYNISTKNKQYNI